MIDDTVKELLSDVSLSENEREQLMVMLESLDIFRLKEMKHKSLWKQAGWQDAAFHIRNKAVRLHRQAMDDELMGDGSDADLDDVLDIINYACFFVRCARAGTKAM